MCLFRTILYLGGLLYCLGSDATHFGGIGGVMKMVIVDGEKGKGWAMDERLG